MAHSWNRIERIGDLVGGALPARVRHGLMGWRAVESWARVAGEDAARRSAATGFRDGRLYVDVVNSVWLYQLSASKRRFVRDLNATIGSGADVVEEIVFRVNPTPGQGPGGGREGR
ncbi:MAG: DUF721 domain-containing protein [Candidatus Eiseniibacteriota bacterium]